MYSQASIFPSREDELSAAEKTERHLPEETVSQWFASFELKVNGRTRYFTFGDRELANQSVDSLLMAVPAEFRSLLEGPHEQGVKISVTLMNGHSLHDNATPPPPAFLD